MTTSSSPTPRPRNRRLLGIAAIAAGALAFTSLTATPALAAEVTATIADVQGDGAATPIAGQTVTVEGVVTGYYGPPSNYRGLYLQTDGSGGAGTDATPGRSDGVFVFFNTANPPVAVGDLIRVTGVAGENFGQTQLSATTAAAFELVEAGAGLPAPTPLPDSVVGGAREPYEGMLVQPTGDYRLASTHELFNFGSLWLSAGGNLVKSTETTDAGPAADAIAAANQAKLLLVDDGYSIQVGNAQHIGEQPYFTTGTVVRTGDRFVPPTQPMVLGFGFDRWRLQPQIPITDASAAAYKPTFESLNPRPAAAPVVGGDVQFGAFNVFNYFTTFGGNARGAANPAQFAIQKAKIVTAINGLGADVVALQEIENSVELGEPVDEALADLVDGLNAAAGAGTWAYVPSPTALQTTGNDVITSAIIYKPAVATPVGDSFADTDAVWDIARDPVAQTFDIGDRTVTVVANHFKSKSPPAGGGTEPADGQGFFNAERTAQAQRLAAFAETIAADPEKGDDILLLGDFNAYGQEDPIQALVAAGFVDLVPTEAAGEYTYTFSGELGSLDHALASSSLARSVTDVGVWGINSPEWGDRGYAFPANDGTSEFRSSDHDPVVLGVTQVEPPVTIDLLSINDFHGRLEAVPPIAGAAVMGGMVNHYEALNPNTLFVGAGDLIGASTFTSFIQQDQPTIDAFNAMGLDASSFGNHEFDQGRDDVDDRVLPEADWPYLAANIYDRATGEPAYQEYELREFEGVTIGFVGAVTEALPSLVSPGGIASLEVRGIVPEVNRVADELSDGDESNGEADVVILLVHEGAATTALSSATDNSAFGQIVNGLDADVDMIVSGHTHLAYDHDIPIPGTDRTRPVISSGQYGQMYGHSVITVDPNTGELVGITSENLPLANAFPPDQEVADIVAAAVAAAGPLGDVSLGSITEDIRRGRQNNPAVENRGSESTLGNLIAEAQLAATEDLATELAIMNPGGIRADLLYASTGAVDPAGNVTYREAATAQPFANTLVTMTLTGAQLKTVLEQQWQPAGAQRPFLRLGLSSGFEYTYNPGAATGSHITSMSLNGEQVTPDQVIKIVTNSFLSTGGDNFFELAQGAGIADSGRIDLEALVDYIGDNSPVAPDYSQRSVGVTLTPPADGVAYQAGESVTLSLSSLLMSNGSVASGDATVSLGGSVLGTAPIAFTIVDTQDEQGTATVAITIPDGVVGSQLLTIEGPGGTSVDVPIEVAAAPEPVDTSLRATVNRLIVFGNQTVTYRVTATAADGSEPVGTVTVYDGSRVLTTIELEAGDGGRASVTLPRLSRGLHILTGRFAGEGFEPSVAFPSLVLVLR